MSYTYKSVQNKPVNPPPSQVKPSEVKPIRELSKQQLRTYESVFLIINYVLKSNQSKKIKQSFTKIKTVVQNKKKYSELLAKKINYLFKHKQKQYTYIFFNSLVSNKITFYNTQMTTHKQLKQNSRTRAVGILFHAFQKIYNKKFKNAFQELNQKSLAYAKARVFKTTHLFARISLAYRRKLQGAFNKIVKNKALVGRKGKVFTKLQNFFSVKNKRNIISSFNRMKVNLYKSKLSQVETPAIEQQKAQTKQAVGAQKINVTPGVKIQQQRRELEQRAKQLQAQIQQLQQTSTKNVTTLKNQVSRLEKQTQSLRFNNDLLDQSNSQLERQIQSKQLRGRKKLSKNEIWQNVYNNLIYFLAVNRNKTISKEQLIQCLETPLVPCNTNLEQLNDENKVLTELLTQYKKSFPQPQNNSSQSQNMLPYDLLKKKNRYFYMVLEVLSEWGISGSKQLQQLNLDLQTLQSKLVE